MRLILGTRKGLVFYKKTATGWQFVKDEFKGIPVSMFFKDEHTGRWFAGLSHGHWGEKLHYSNDEGKTWKELPPPAFPNDADEIEDGVKATVQLLWSMNSTKKALWLGTVPGALFKSEDNGESFQLVESLWQHPSRKKDWFGGGFKYAGIHSIEVHPKDENRFYIGISCAGVFETQDNGKSWIVRNKGLKADYLPNPAVEVGHDPHRLILCRSEPNVLWQQNHCGIFRSDDDAQTWQNVTQKQNLADFGFSLTIDHFNPNNAWVIPGISDEIRVAIDSALVVCKTNDGGKNWKIKKKGLPQAACYDIVYRHAFDGFENNLAFGTTTGNLFVSENSGENWQHINAFLPLVNTVNFVP